MLALSGIGGYPFVGTPDKIAAEFANPGSAGFRGRAVSFVNYLDGVPYFCTEVLPRLARMDSEG
jgi:alkanesulfonate monooxygenase SsuD/methylene tetrahydromethanopterin reductase-like flavin-dependent oxidoreductase (luciferase family)